MCQALHESFAVSKRHERGSEICQRVKARCWPVSWTRWNSEFQCCKLLRQSVLAGSKASLIHVSKQSRRHILWRSLASSNSCYPLAQKMGETFQKQSNLSSIASNYRNHETWKTRDPKQLSRTKRATCNDCRDKVHPKVWPTAWRQLWSSS